MEHRLILGGEQFLPFARSCIAKLKKLGLPYANQSYEVDGVSIKVRIEPGHEYIRLEGGSSAMAMDSGVVDLLGVNPGSSDSYAPGILYRSDSVSAYDAGFLMDSEPPDGRKGRKGNGAVDGSIVVKPKIEGVINPDASPAESFAPDWITDNSTTPHGKMRNPSSDALVAKKVAATFVPASIFTGKCRLFVQALYGRHLFDEKGVVSSYPVAGDSGASTPFLRIDAYTWKGETTNYGQITVSTSTGVYLDPATARHWMLRIGYGEVTIYPLIAPAAITALRPLLKSPKMTQEDKDHLEAYILGYCLPDAKNAQTVSLGAPITTYSMGYGWHWNFSGTMADIVLNAPFEYEPGNVLGPMGMKSSHYRITTSLSDGVWSAAMTAIESEVVWSLNRNLWTVVEPSWSGGQALKVTSGKFDLDLLPGKSCDAPFYVFYNQDALNVCRVKISHDTTTAERVSSPYYAGGAPFSSVSATTIGYSGGKVEDKGAFTHYNAIFSIGGYSTPLLPASAGRAWHKTESSGKTPSGVFSSGYSVSYGPNCVVTEGSWPNRTYTDLGSGGIKYGQYEQLAYTLTDTNGTETLSSFCAVIVPKNDAESVYVRAQANSDKSSTGTKYTIANQDSLGNGNANLWSEKQTFYPSAGGSVDYFSYNAIADWPGSYDSYTTDPAYSEHLTSVSYDASFLLCRRGEIDTPIADLNQLFSVGPDDMVNEYFVQSGTRTDTSVIQWLSPKLTGCGSLPTNATIPVLVGWI